LPPARRGKALGAVAIASGRHECGRQRGARRRFRGFRSASSRPEDPARSQSWSAMRNFGRSPALRLGATYRQPFIDARPMRGYFEVSSSPAVLPLPPVPRICRLAISSWMSNVHPRDLHTTTCTRSFPSASPRSTSPRRSPAAVPISHALVPNLPRLRRSTQPLNRTPLIDPTRSLSSHSRPPDFTPTSSQS
jgi:hypothetical protein